MFDLKNLKPGAVIPKISSFFMGLQGYSQRGDEILVGELGVQFTEVSNVFVVTHQRLTSLKGFPTRVGSYISADNNMITGLQHLRGKFNTINLSGNKITSLEGMEDLEDNGDLLLVLSGNPLKSFEGLNPNFSGWITFSFDFGSPKFSMRGLHSKVRGVNVSGVKLSLEGCPEEVGSMILCRNELKTLEGSPRKINGEFNCSHNPLESLKGCPDYVTGGLIIPPVKDLTYLPKQARDVEVAIDEISGPDLTIKERKEMELEISSRMVGTDGKPISVSFWSY